MSEQIVTISFFEFQGTTHRWWGFKQMGLSPAALSKVAGLQFSKALGSGAGNGFSIRPNFGVYGILGVWETEAAARTFFATHKLFRAYRKRAAQYWTTFMRTAMVHGQWEGGTPFQVTTDYDKNRPVAVITRATIHTRHLWNFWRFVPAVSDSMSEHQEGLHFSVGIGELPLIQQATFSLWQDSHAMQAYAYRSAHHREVIQKTRELGWYKEELFARFHPYAFEGDWKEVPVGTLLTSRDSSPR